MPVKGKKKQVVLRKMISFLLAFLLVIGILPVSKLSSVYAATEPLVLREKIFLRDLPTAGGDSDPVDEGDLVDTEGLTPPVTEGNGLVSDETQAQQAAKLGLPTDQPSRLSPSGKEVDKKQNPLGPDLLVTNRIYSLAYSRLDGQYVYPSPVNADGKISMFRPVADKTSDAFDAFSAANRVVAAADVDGDGTQELVTVGVVSAGFAKWDLQLFVENYNSLTGSWNKKEATSSAIYTVAESISYPGIKGYNNDSLKIAAGDFDRDGKDEVAISAENTVYLCKADMSSFQKISTRTYDDSIRDLEAKDANGDGFPELLVVKKAGSTAPQLLIYSGNDLSSSSHSINLEYTRNGFNTYFESASVDVGDIFGEGRKKIVIAGKSGSGIFLTSIGFDPKAESYDTSMGTIYQLNSTVEDHSAFKAVQSLPDIKCVSLTTPVPGDPVSIVLSGVIFKYSTTNEAFERQSVTNSTVNGDAKTNSETTAQGNITNANKDKDATWILNTIVGNFDGNKEGQEQIIMLHYNEWYDKELVYLTQCHMGSDDKLTANLSQIWKKSDDTPYKYPAICAIDYENSGVTLKFHPDKSKFMFTNPIVSAVLAVSPYYEELADVCAGLDQASTVYGTGTEKTESTSNGVTANVGVTYGFEQGFSVLGVQIAQISFEAAITNSFAYTWEKGKSIEKTSSFTNLFTDNAVVVTVIPQDVYYYTASYKDSNGNIRQEDMVIQIPYAPITTIKPVSEYNLVAAGIPNAPIIDDEVLGNITIGDPRTYPDTADGLSNVDDADVILAGSDENSSFDGCGTGDSAGEQSITSTSFEGKAFDYELSYNASYNVAVFGVGTGISYGAGYTRSSAETNSEFTTRMGTVASVPAAHSQYEFQWALAVYNYDLPAGDSVQRCEVINYLVKPIGNYPPKIPENFALDSQTPTENVLKWEAAEGSAGYTVTRFTAEIGTEPDKTFTIAGKDTLSFTDTEIEKNKTYYYQILAYDTKNSMTVGPIKADGLSVTGISIKTQPQLVYNEDDPLNLSALVVTLETSNGGSYDVAFSDFENADLTTSLANEFKLTTSETGTPVAVKYNLDQTANTGNLTVNAKSPYDFTIMVSFKVGTKKDATALEANQTLEATTQLTNTTASAQDVLVILALYSDKGNMEKSSYVTKNIAAAETQTVAPSLTLPANVSGYTAKVFVWDGTSFTTTTLSPKSPTVRIP